jgi:hypothetical protein
MNQGLLDLENRRLALETWHRTRQTHFRRTSRGVMSPKGTVLRILSQLFSPLFQRHVQEPVRHGCDHLEPTGSFVSSGVCHGGCEAGLCVCWRHVAKLRRVGVFEAVRVSNVVGSGFCLAPFDGLMCLLGRLVLNWAGNPAFGDCPCCWLHFPFGLSRFRHVQVTVGARWLPRKDLCHR